MVRGIHRIYLLTGTLMLGVLLVFFVVVLSGGVKAQAQQATGDPVLAAAGDIVQCSSLNDEATAALLTTVPGAMVATLGDNAYPDGSAQDYDNCYGPSWGVPLGAVSTPANRHDSPLLVPSPHPKGGFRGAGCASGGGERPPRPRLRFATYPRASSGAGA
jgi:hypothetical protein